MRKGDRQKKDVDKYQTKNADEKTREVYSPLAC